MPFPRARSPAAFTIAELTVALLIGVNLLGILFAVFIQDQRRHAVDQARLAALQGIVLFGEALESDVRRIALAFPDPPPAPESPFTVDEPIQLGGGAGYDPAVLKMRIFRQDQRPDRDVETEEVVWRRDPATGAVTRNGRPIRGLLAESLQFALSSLKPDTAALGPDAPRKLHDLYRVHAIKVQISALTDSSAGDPESLRARKRVTMVLVQPVLYRSDRANHPNWNFVMPEIVPGGTSPP